MPRQLQLEGPELEPLLDRVRSEIGDGARIVSAEKVRTGGIGGFFARQRFELTLEVDEEDPAAAPAAGRPPTSLLDLVDQVDADEQAAVSTETPTFASLMARLGSAVGPTPTRTPAPAPVAVRAHAAAATAVPQAPPVPQTALVTHAAPMPQTGPAAQTEPAAPQTEPVPPALSAIPSQRRPAAGEVALRSPGRVAVPAATPKAGAVAVSPGPASAGAAALPPAGGCELARLGLPEHLRPEAGGGDVYPALVERLRRLPKAPRTTNRAGGVLAVVGPLPLALEVAREMTRELGLPVASTVFLADSSRTGGQVPDKQRIASPDLAATRRAGWRRRRNLTVVVVAAPLTSAGASAARAFLGALEPTCVYGVVEATRKAQDVGTWARALGGVHALAVTGVEETADPAAVLELGIPVGRLGGRPATPTAWASLLTGRLAA